MSHQPSTRSRALTLAISLTVAFSVSACAGTADGEADGATIENCDRQVEVGKAPERVVSLNQGTTELLLALGLEDRMVGTATWTEPVRSDLAEANEQVPRLADDTPSFEAVLDAEPDFVMGLYHAMFTDDRVATRDSFEEVGVRTWLSPTSCFPGEEETLGEPVELDDIYGDGRGVQLPVQARVHPQPMRPTGGWKSISDVEIAVAEYIDWCNHRRLHREIGLISPAEFETNHWASTGPEHYPETPVPAAKLHVTGRWTVDMLIPSPEASCRPRTPGTRRSHK